MEHREEQLTCREVALALHEAGLIPLPTRPGEPHPAMASEELTGRAPTAEEIEAWYRDDPRRGVALLVGRSILVVEIDPRRGADGAPFLGTTPVVLRTPAGGWQLFYSVTNGATIRSRASASPGVELRARDAVVVLPPTRLVRGTHRWEPGAFEALLCWDLPDYTRVPPVRELVERPGGPRPSAEWPQKGASWVAQELEVAVTPVGSQEETLVRMAGVLAATGAPRDVATACLWSWAQRLEQAPDRPWQRAVVSAMVDRVYAAAAEPPRAEASGAGSGLAADHGVASRGVALGAGPGAGSAPGAYSGPGVDPRRGIDPRTGGDIGPDLLPDEGHGAPGDEGEATLIARARAACRSQRELSRVAAPDIEWAIPSFLAYEAIHELRGGPGSGKSTLVSWWAHSLVTGAPFAAAAVGPTAVLWLTDEPRGTFERLLRRVGLNESPDLHVISYWDVRGIPWALVVKATVQVAQARRARVLIVDSFTTFARADVVGPTAEDGAAVVRAFDALRPALAARMAVVVVRRARTHAAGPTARGLAGGGPPAHEAEAPGEADVTYYMSRASSAHPDGTRLLRATGRFGELVPALRTLTLVPDRGYRAGAATAEDATPPRIPPRWHEIAALLPPLTTRENGQVQGITADALAKAARMSARSIRDMLKAVQAAEVSDAPLGQLAWVEASTGKRKVTYYGRPVGGAPGAAAAGAERPRGSGSADETVSH